MDTKTKQRADEKVKRDAQLSALPAYQFCKGCCSCISHSWLRWQQQHFLSPQPLPTISSLAFCRRPARFAIPHFAIRFSTEAEKKGTIFKFSQKEQESLTCFFHSLASGCFRGFSEKKRLNACGYAREYLRSCSGYGPGRSVKRRGKSSMSAFEKIFCLGGVGFLWVTS